jgi:hypothetical protein
MSVNNKSKKIIMLFISFVSFFSLASIAMATDYYVGAKGSDRNNGLSPGQEWATFEKALNEVRPGDTVYVMAGTYGRLLVQGKSGNKGAPITFKAYPGTKPIIRNDANWNSQSKGRGIDVRNSHWFIFDGFEIKRVWAGLWVDEGSTHITLQNSEIHETYRIGIKLKGWSQHLSILDNLIYDTNQSFVLTGSGNGEGIYIGESNELDIEVRHVLIRGNTFHTIRNDVINLKPTVFDITIENNIIYDAVGSSPSQSSGILIEHTYYKPNEPRNFIIRGNIIYNVSDSSSSAYGDGIRIKTGALVYNNVIYANQRYGIYIDGRHTGDVPAMNTQIYNNTIYSNGKGSIKISNMPSSRLDIKNNLGYNASDNMTASSSYFKNVSGSPGDWDFRLTSSATAAIDTAATLTDVPDDADGNTRPCNSLYDYGAYEYCEKSKGEGSAVPLPPQSLRVTFQE